MIKYALHFKQIQSQADSSEQTRNSSHNSREEKSMNKEKSGESIAAALRLDLNWIQAKIQFKKEEEHNSISVQFQTFNFRMKYFL